MALFKFVSSMLKGDPIEIYVEGKMSRDFTYVDDLVEAIVRPATIIPTEETRVTTPGVTDTLSKQAPYRVVNLGGGQSVELMRFVETVEKSPRPAAKPRDAADAAGRCAAHLCRARPSAGTDRLHTLDPRRTGRRGVREMVSRMEGLSQRHSGIMSLRTGAVLFILR